MIFVCNIPSSIEDIWCKRKKLSSTIKYKSGKSSCMCCLMFCVTELGSSGVGICHPWGGGGSSKSWRGSWYYFSNCYLVILYNQALEDVGALGTETGKWGKKTVNVTQKEKEYVPVWLEGRYWRVSYMNHNMNPKPGVPPSSATPGYMASVTSSPSRASFLTCKMRGFDYIDGHTGCPSRGWLWGSTRPSYSAVAPNIFFLGVSCSVTEQAVYNVVCCGFD